MTGIDRRTLLKRTAAASAVAYAAPQVLTTSVAGAQTSPTCYMVLATYTIGVGLPTFTDVNVGTAAAMLSCDRGTGEVSSVFAGCNPNVSSAGGAAIVSASVVTGSVGFTQLVLPAGCKVRALSGAIIDLNNNNEISCATLTGLGSASPLTATNASMGSVHNGSFQVGNDGRVIQFSRSNIALYELSELLIAFCCDGSASSPIAACP